MKKSALLAMSLFAFGSSAMEFPGLAEFSAISKQSGSSVHEFDAFMTKHAAAINKYLDSVSTVMSVDKIKARMIPYCPRSKLPQLNKRSQLNKSFSILTERHKGLIPTFQKIYAIMYGVGDANVEAAATLSFLDNAVTNGGCYQGFRNRMILDLLINVIAPSLE
jgi:hypothetical protein